MNIFKKCSICGQIFRLCLHEEFTLESHLKEAHPNEYREMLRLKNEYRAKVDELNKAYERRRVSTYFVGSDKKEWGKVQPLKVKPMDELLICMKEGWEVGRYGGWVSHITAQKDGLGCGGEAKNYSITTVEALINRGLIKRVDTRSFPLIEKFVLTEKRQGGLNDE